MKKMIKTFLILVWILAAAGVILPLVVKFEPVTNFLSGLRNYLVAGLIVITLIAIAWIIMAKYRNEVSDDDKKLILNKPNKGLSRKAKEKMFTDFQLAEFTLSGEDKIGELITETLTKRKLVTESLVVTSPSKKEQMKAEKQQLKADKKAEKEREFEDLLKVKNRKHSWLVWILLIPFLAIMSYGYYIIFDLEKVDIITFTDLDKYIIFGGFILGALLFILVLIITLIKRKNVLPAFATFELVSVVVNRYSVYAFDEFGHFNPNDIIGMLTNLPYVLYNVGVLGSMVMLIIFMAHYSKRKYIYLNDDQIKAKEEKVTAKEQKVADKVAAKEAKKLAKEQKAAEKAAAKEAKAKAEKEEQERIAKEKAEQERIAKEKAEQERLAKEKEEQERLAKEKAEQERLAKEKEEQERLAKEKAEQERLAKEKAEQERLAKEKAEQERLAKEKAEQERLAKEKEEALKAELVRLAAEEATKSAAKTSNTKLIKIKPVAKTKVKLWTGFNLNVSSGWVPYLEREQGKRYYKNLMTFVSKAYEANNVYPAKENLFKCFEYTDLANTKVVILGKIPFYRKDQADGLAYSTKEGSAMNQTTKVIIQEAVNDVGIKNTTNGSFVNWAKQGVLLLNSIMTAPTDKPASHSECGWVEFTDGVLKLLNEDNKPKVFILLGEHARERASLITNSKHMIFEAANPSPLSAANGFYGSKPFSKTNEFLIKHGYEPIDWEL